MHYKLLGCFNCKHFQPEQISEFSNSTNQDPEVTHLFLEILAFLLYPVKKR